MQNLEEKKVRTGALIDSVITKLKRKQHKDKV